MRRAVLAGVCEKENASEFQTGMNECMELCRTAGYHILDVIVQNSISMDRKTAFRSGKLSELKNLCMQNEAEAVIFYNDLGIQTALRISEFCEGIEVIDRTSLILRIFSLHARTRQARLQIEMARLQYALPRTSDKNETETHQRGGSMTNRGSGEMRSDILVRQYRHRLKELRAQLDQIQKDHHQDENRRSKTLLKRAALVGYTNAGKSSLMNCLLSDGNSAGTYVKAQDQLFATLDTSVRMTGTEGRKYFLYDTVGFVSHMPPQLLDAFHTTLESVKDADLLIHVIDVSDKEWMKKAQITINTLQEIGADKIPVLTVGNKIDLIDNEMKPEGVSVSCLTGEGIHALQKKIVTMLYPVEASIFCELPYQDMHLYNEYKSVLNIESVEHNEKGTVLHLKGPDEYISVFRKYEIEREKNDGKENSLGQNE